MKKIALLALIAVTAYSCNKDKSKPLTITNPNAMKYSVNGISDVEVVKRDSTELAITLAYISGNQERVSVVVTGLPTGVTARFEPASGIPTYSTNLVIVASKNAPAGAHPIKISISTPLGDPKTFDLTLNIKPISDCSPLVIGNYSVETICNTSNTTPSSANVFAISNKPSQVNIILPTFLGFPATVKALVDCEKDSIFVSDQYFMSSLRLRGTGSFSDTSMDIRYSLVDTTTGSTFPADTCTAHFSKN